MYVEAMVRNLCFSENFAHVLNEWPRFELSAVSLYQNLCYPKHTDTLYKTFEKYHLKHWSLIWVFRNNYRNHKIINLDDSLWWFALTFEHAAWKVSLSRVFLIRFSLHLDRIRRDTPYLFIYLFICLFIYLFIYLLKSCPPPKNK